MTRKRRLHRQAIKDINHYSAASRQKKGYQQWAMHYAFIVADAAYAHDTCCMMNLMAICCSHDMGSSGVDGGLNPRESGARYLAT